jgi:hypothetical protein
VQRGGQEQFRRTRAQQDVFLLYPFLLGNQAHQLPHQRERVQVAVLERIDNGAFGFLGGAKRVLVGKQAGLERRRVGQEAGFVGPGQQLAAAGGVTGKSAEGRGSEGGTGSQGGARFEPVAAGNG